MCSESGLQVCLSLVGSRLEAMDSPRHCEQPQSIKVACVCCLQTAISGPMDSTSSAGAASAAGWLTREGEHELQRGKAVEVPSPSCAACRLLTLGPGQR